MHGPPFLRHGPLTCFFHEQGDALSRPLVRFHEKLRPSDQSDSCHFARSSIFFTNKILLSKNLIVSTSRTDKRTEQTLIYKIQEMEPNVTKFPWLGDLYMDYILVCIYKYIYIYIYIYANKYLVRVQVPPPRELSYIWFLSLDLVNQSSFCPFIGPGSRNNYII